MPPHALEEMAAVAERSADAAHSRPPSDLSWHAQPVEAVLRRLATSNSGLAASEAALRLDRVGPNELREVAHVSAWHTLADQFKNVLIVILLVATAVSALLGHTLEASVIARSS